MKKYFFRIGAFFIDTVIAILIASFLCIIPFINPNADKIAENNDALKHEYELANDLRDKTENYIKDDKINQFEYKEILDQFPTYYDLFKDVVVDEKLSDDFKNNIQNKIAEQYNSIATDYSYDINKMGLNQTIITIIVYMLYFGVLPFVMNGQTLGKKLLRLKVVDAKDEEKRISIWKYLIRAFLIREIIFTLVSIILISVLSKKDFINASFYVGQAQYLYELAFLVCFVLREDQRSIHDLLLGTTVILIDKDGKRVPDPVYIQKEEVQEVKEVKIETKKQVTSSKKTTKKKNTKKEEVKAEKVND